MDNNGDKKLSKEELKYGMRDYGIELSPNELEQIFLYFDKNGDGSIDVSEFLVAIRGEMNDRRKKCVRMAFNILDTDGSGEVTADDLVDKYDFSSDPEVKSGKKTKQEAMRQFMKQWDRIEGDGIVTFDEFCDYYKEISASIDGDDYFELMIRNAWRIAGGEGAAANTANKRVLVTRADGSQYVETVKNELGMKAGDKADIMKRLQQQGVSAANIDLHGGSDDTKKPTKPGQIPVSKKASGGTRDAFTRHVAAAKLAAAFRGRQGRKEAAQEKRKADAIASAKKEEHEENLRIKPKTIIRPKGKSYIGF
jgi:Ca2+-binding EF-hand superfamily protein